MLKKDWDMINICLQLLQWEIFIWSKQQVVCDAIGATCGRVIFQNDLG